MRINRLLALPAGYATELSRHRSLPSARRTHSWATISICAIVTLLVMLANVANAQVTVSLYPNGQPSGWMMQFGPRPYELFGSERAKLIATATRLATPKVPMYDLNAYYGCKEGSEGCIDVGRAEFLFGPYARSDSMFSMDSILCIGTPRKWSLSRTWDCEPKDTWTYFRAGDFDSLISFSSNVGFETAKIIAAYVDSYCSLSKWDKEKRTDRDEILSAPHIYLDKKTDEYERRMESCGTYIKVKDGKVDSATSYGVLR